MLQKYILISILIIGYPVILVAQTADDYFHMASQKYISGNYKESKQLVSEGLAKYPSDPKLNVLNTKIKEPSPQDQKNQKQQQKQDIKQQPVQQPKPQPQKDQMNKDEADRIMQALQNKEKENMKKQKEQPAQPEKVDKDW